MKKPLDHMTNREIVSAIVALILIGGLVVAAAIMMAVRNCNLFSIIWVALSVIVVMTVFLRQIASGIRELRRRKHKTSNQ